MTSMRYLRGNQTPDLECVSAKKCQQMILFFLNPLMMQSASAKQVVYKNLGLIKGFLLHHSLPHCS